MGKGKKAMLEITKMKMTPALSAEHQRKWDESRWECKMDDPERNYDKSRAHLNFEVRKGAVIAPVDKSVCIKEIAANGFGCKNIGIVTQHFIGGCSVVFIELQRKNG